MKESKLEAHITALRDSMGEALKSLSLLSKEQKWCQEKTNRAIRTTETRIHSLEEFLNKEQLGNKWVSGVIQTNMKANLGTATKIILLLNRIMRSQAALQE